MKKINLDQSHPIYDSREECNAIIETNTDRLLVGCSSTVIPDGVREIAFGAFENCKDLETLNIPQSVVAIGTAAFSCSGLKEIVLPDALTTVESATFAQCEHLESVKLPAGLKSIGSGAFSKCTSLRSIDIPAGVKKIDECAFQKCVNLKTITLPAGISKIAVDAFNGCTSLECRVRSKSEIILVHLVEEFR